MNSWQVKAWYTSPTTLDPSEYEDSCGGASCQDCGIVVQPDSLSYPDMKEVADFISEHDRMGHATYLGVFDDGNFIPLERVHAEKQ